MSFAVPLTASEAAIYDSLVVPRYMRLFGAGAVATLLPDGHDALVATRDGAVYQLAPGSTGGRRSPAPWP